MIEPKSQVAKNCTDRSSFDGFQFVFHCERCGIGVLSQRYPFSSKDFIQPLNEKARSLIWSKQHEEAYGRAYEELQPEFNVCPVCGRRICNACLHESEKIFT